HRHRSHARQGGADHREAPGRARGEHAGDCRGHQGAGRGQDLSLMRTAVQISGDGGPWAALVDYVVEAERLGVDVCWVAEAWGCDAPSPLGYLAARTERILLGSGVMQLGTRTPAMTAMTALTLARLSDNRFLLGLGTSGPQVM